MIVAAGLQFPEGPAVDHDDRLYCCELLGGCITLIGAHGSPEPVVKCHRPNGLAVHPEDGSLWVADSGARAILRAVPGSDPRIMEAGPFLGPNDLIFAPDGTLYFTDPLGSSAENPIGAVYRRDSTGAVSMIASGLAFPNGLALVDGGRALIVAETLRHRLLRLDLITLTVEPFCDVGRGPDGVALAPDGRLYVALYREGCVAVVRPDGTVQDKLPVDDEHPTNCCLHGRDLYVTLAATGRVQKLTLEE